MLFFHKWGDAPLCIFISFMFGRIQNKWRVSPQSPLKSPWYMQVPYLTSQCHYWAEYFFDIEHLTYSCCISSKTLAKETPALKTSASQHPSDISVIKSVRNLQNKS